MNIKDFLHTNHISVKLGRLKSASEVDYKLVSKFARSTPHAIGAGFFLILILLMTVSFFKLMTESWLTLEYLSSLSNALFYTGVVLAWGLAAGIGLLLYPCMIFGQHALLVHSGKVEFLVGTPWFGVCIVYPKEGKQLKFVVNDEKRNSQFGSNHTQLELERLQHAIEINLGVSVDLDSVSERKPRNKREAVSNKFMHIQQSASDSVPISWASSSTLVLIAVNLVPLIGIAFFDWGLGTTMVLYWAETAIVLFFTILKKISQNLIAGLLSSLFMSAQVAIFMAVNFLFIWSVFVQVGPNVRTPLSEVAAYMDALWLTLLALLISHGYSFKKNYLDRQDRRQQKVSYRDLYSRIFVLQIAVVFGGGATLIMGNSFIAFLILVALKIFVDGKLHIRQYSQ